MQYVIQHVLFAPPLDILKLGSSENVLEVVVADWLNNHQMVFGYSGEEYNPPDSHIKAGISLYDLKNGYLTDENKKQFHISFLENKLIYPIRNFCFTHLVPLSMALVVGIAAVVDFVVGSADSAVALDLRRRHIGLRI